MDSHCVLDEIVNEDSVEILKAALPYLPSSGQSFISIFAKFLELQNTIRMFQKPQGAMRICAQSPDKTDPLEMLNACSKVCHGPMKERLDSLINTLLMLQMFDLSQKSPSPDLFSEGKGGNPRHE